MMGSVTAMGAMVLSVAHATLAASAPTVIEHVKVEVGDGTVLESVAVLLEGGRIRAVGQVSAPADARHIDGVGKVLTAGLIETRSHLGLSEVDQEGSANDYVLDQAGSMVPAFRAADGFNPASVRIPRAREEGITSAITIPGGQVIYGTGSWFDLTGRFSSRPNAANPVAMYGGVGGGAAAAAGGSRGGVWLMLREAIAEARSFQKNPAGVDQSKRGSVLKPWHLEAMVPVLEGKLPWVIDADRASDILTVLELAKSEHFRVVIAGGAEAWRVARELAAAKVPVIVKPTAQQPQSFDQLAARTDTATLLAAAGVPLLLTAGSSNMEINRLRQEAGIAVAYGLTHEAALTAITQTPAQVFGHGQDLGTVTVGKRANVVLWSGDPFETSTVAEQVWIDGELQSLDTRQRKLAERYLGK